MKLRRRRRVKAFPQKRSQLGGCGLLPAAWGCGAMPPPSPAVARADDESLVPPQAAGLALSVARPLPTETASLGFGGSPVGGGDKNSRVIFFTFLCGGYHLPSGCCGCVGTTPHGVYFGRKTAFSEWVLCADGHAVPSCTQRFFGVPTWGWYHYPRRALHAVETLDAHGSRRRIRRFCAAAVLALCGQNIPSSGTHATRPPNRAHSGSHAETRGIFTARDIGRVDRVSSLGTLCIVTFGTA